jgi:hypothetical protein
VSRPDPDNAGSVALGSARRTVRPNAAERIALEVDEVAAELRQASTQLEGLQRVQEPMPATKKFVRQTMAARSGPWPSGGRRPMTVLPSRIQ